MVVETLVIVLTVVPGPELVPVLVVSQELVFEVSVVGTTVVDVHTEVL